MNCRLLEIGVNPLPTNAIYCTEGVGPLPTFKENPLATMFPMNEGGVDRAVRIIAGLVVLSLMFVGPKSMCGLVGAVPLLTGLVGTCPLYSVLPPRAGSAPVRTRRGSGAVGDPAKARTCRTPRCGCVLSRGRL